MELVIGMVVFAIVLVMVSTLFTTQAQRSVDPILQVRATELAQSLINEITAKSFDENSDRSGGQVRCGEDLTGDGDADDAADGELGDCSAPAAFDDGESREDYDDVDDYNGLSIIQNAEGENIEVDSRNLYQGFQLSVSVFYDSDYDCDESENESSANHKCIKVTVTTPTNESLVYSTYRSNY